MQIICTVDIRTRELALDDVTIAAFDHLVDDVLFDVEPIDGFELDTSTIKIAAVGPLGEQHDYEIDPSTVTVDEETGNTNFIWSIPVGVTAMPLSSFKINDIKKITFAVCAEIVSGDNLVKAWHSNDGTIKVKAHLEPESGGGETPEEQATNAQKIAALQRQVDAISSGAPTTAASTDGMDPTVSTIYVNTTDGHLYFWDGEDWQIGGFYGANIVDDTVSEAGMAAEAAAVRTALNAKADVNDVTAIDERVTAVEGTVETVKNTVDGFAGYRSDNLHDPTTTTTRGYWNSEGGTSAGTTWRRTALMDIEGCTQIEYTGIRNASTSTFNVFFGDDGTTVKGVFPQTLCTDTTLSEDVPADAKYVSFSVDYRYVADLMVYGVVPKTMATMTDLASVEESLTAQVDEAKDAVADLEAGTGEMLKVYEDGYRYIDAEWMNGSWTGVGTTHSYNYIVRTVNPVQFSEDTLIRADVGFQIAGACLYADGTSESIGSFRMAWMFPAGSTGYINVRRMDVDTSERPDPAEFSRHLKIISGRMTEFNAVRDTFYGIEMFKSIGFCGDSYTAGRQGHTWADTLGRQIGTDVSVFAQSGINSKGWRSNSSNGLLKLLASTACELYWINLGINDASSYHDIPEYLGSVEDLTGDYTTYPETFWGNMGCIIESILAYAPNAKIVLEKAMFANPLNSYQRTATTDIPVINQAIEEIGSHYGIPVIDMLDDVFYWSDEWSRGIYSNHPDIYMYPGMAQANRRLFSRCVRDNYSYFAQWLL